MNSARQRRFSIHGRVQGVFFRDSTRQRALELGLAGYARNLPDGTVEVAASGAPGALDALADWLQRGPPMARVERVVELSAPAAPFDGFTTG